MYGRMGYPQTPRKFDELEDDARAPAYNRGPEGYGDWPQAPVSAKGGPERPVVDPNPYGSPISNMRAPNAPMGPAYPRYGMMDPRRRRAAYPRIPAPQMPWMRWGQR